MQNRLDLVVSTACLLMLAAPVGLEDVESLALVVGALPFAIGLLVTCTLIRAAAPLSAWHVTQRLQTRMLR